jgi:hypothetical protein
LFVLSTTVTSNVIVPELHGVPEIVAVIAVVDDVVVRHIAGRVGLLGAYPEIVRLYGETPPVNEIVT